MGPSASQSKDELRLIVVALIGYAGVMIRLQNPPEYLAVPWQEPALAVFGTFISTLFLLSGLHGIRHHWRRG